MTGTDPLDTVRTAAASYGRAQEDLSMARERLHAAIREAGRNRVATRNKIAEAARPMSRPTVFAVLGERLYAEMRHADGTPLPGSPIRELLDTYGRSTQEAVDDLARELKEQGGWGDIDLADVRGQVALYAVHPDGADVGVASAPWFPRRGAARVRQ